jgi:hypothetical protein
MMPFAEERRKKKKNYSFHFLHFSNLVSLILPGQIPPPLLNIKRRVDFTLKWGG